MSELLSEDENKWLRKLDLLLAKAPKSLAEKVSTFTIGDSNIVMFDRKKVDEYTESLGSADIPDMCALVKDAGIDTRTFNFPFAIESTAG